MLRIRELAERSGFTPKTLRYYDSIGLLRPDRRHPVTRIREYEPEALTALVLIRSARNAGLRLSEIREFLASLRRSTRLPKARSILEGRLEELERSARALRDLRKRMEAFTRKRRR